MEKRSATDTVTCCCQGRTGKLSAAPVRPGSRQSEQTTADRGDSLRPGLTARPHKPTAGSKPVGSCYVGLRPRVIPRLDWETVSLCSQCGAMILRLLLFGSRGLAQEKTNKKVDSDLTTRALAADELLQHSRTAQERRLLQTTLHSRSY